MTLEERVLRLERANRRWRWIVAGMVFVLLATMSCTQEGPGSPGVRQNSATAADTKPREVKDTLWVHDIKLVDENGEIRGSLGASKNGASMYLLSGDRKGHISLLAESPPGHDGFASFQVINKDHTARMDMAGISLVPVDFSKREERRRLSEEARKSEREGRELTPGFQKRFRDAYSDPAPSVRIWKPEGGGGVIEVYNVFGKEAVSIQANKTNTGAVYVYDVNGKVKNVLSGSR